MGYGSDDDSDDDDDGAVAGPAARPSEPVPEAPEESEGGGAESGNGSNLPTGFFDNEEADMRARGIEPGDLKKASETEDLAAFLKFAEEVTQTEQDFDDEQRIFAYN